MADPETNPYQRGQPTDKLDARQLWEINNSLKTLHEKYEESDKRIDSIIKTLDGAGQESGIRQQLRDLRHYIEGNPPAMRGIIRELEAINQSYVRATTDISSKHEQLRKDFESYVKNQAEEAAKRQGAWGGARLIWTLLGGTLGILGIILTMFIQIKTAVGG